MKYLLGCFGLVFLLINCKTQIAINNEKAKTFEFGEYSMSTMLGGVSFDFKANHEVVYNWNSDIANFDRTGYYTIHNDTIEIKYEPLISITRSIAEEKLSTFQLMNKEREELVDCNITFFKNGIEHNRLCNEHGIIKIEERMEEIDSIYFNWDFVNLGVYPTEHKYIPKLDKIGYNLLEGFNHLEVKLEEDLIGHPISTNNTTLLIVGKNELYPGIDYDPNTIYVLGLLKKACK